MERLDIYLYTYLEINKDDFVGAKMYFYEHKTEVLKNAFLAYKGYVYHPTPIIADCYGRFPKIFIEKPYSVSILDSTGKKIFDDDIE